jgi:tetracycline repressor-like protein
MAHHAALAGPRKPGHRRGNRSDLCDGSLPRHPGHRRRYLRRLARSLVKFLNSPIGKAILAATLSDAARIPEITDAKHRFFADRFRRAELVVSGAIARGQLPAATDPAELVRTMVAPIYLRLLVTAEPVDETTADNTRGWHSPPPAPAH